MVQFSVQTGKNLLPVPKWPCKRKNKSKLGCDVIYRSRTNYFESSITGERSDILNICKLFIIRQTQNKIFPHSRLINSFLEFGFGKLLLWIKRMVGCPNPLPPSSSFFRKNSFITMFVHLSNEISDQRAQPLLITIK